MNNQSKMAGSFLSILISLGLFLTITPQTIWAKTELDMSNSAIAHTSQFQKIEQPLSLKVAVVLGGLGLIGAELWWFMFSKTKS